jgi:hypothetical protein
MTFPAKPRCVLGAGGFGVMTFPAKPRCVLGAGGFGVMTFPAKPRCALGAGGFSVMTFQATPRRAFGAGAFSVMTFQRRRGARSARLDSAWGLLPAQARAVACGRRCLNAFVEQQVCHGKEFRAVGRNGEKQRKTSALCHRDVSFLQ